MSESPEKALEILLKDLFSAEQLRRVLRKLPGGEALVDELPTSPASTAEVIHQAVNELKRAGMINDELVDLLLAERPRKAEQIGAVASRWHVRTRAVSASVTDQIPAAASNPASHAGSATRVFLSYSQDTPAHKNAVRALADRLRADGIDAWIDQYVAAPPEGWPRWMTNQVEQSRYILLICTETYKRRFEGRETPGAGKGATWEGQLATQVLYDAGTINEKLVPVLLDGANEEQIPLALRPYTHYRLIAGYDALYRHLTGQPAVVAPPLGAVRALPPVAQGTALPPLSPVSAGLPATPPTVAQNGGQHIDNRGAQIGQVINVQGGATFTFGTLPEVPKRR